MFSFDPSDKKQTSPRQSEMFGWFIAKQIIRNVFCKMINEMCLIHLIYGPPSPAPATLHLVIRADWSWLEMTQIGKTGSPG